jgi:hypothetical protein
MRTLALPKEVEHWSLTTLREKLVKIDAKVVRHGRYVTFQLAEVAVSRDLFRKILSLIDDLRPRPAPAWAEEIHGEVETTGEVRLDDDKIGRMGFWTPATDENRAIRKAEAEDLPNDGVIWVTSPWKPSYLGYIGLSMNRSRRPNGGDG